MAQGNRAVPNLHGAKRLLSGLHGSQEIIIMIVTFV